VAVVVAVTVPVLIAVVGAVALWWTGRTDTVGAVDLERPLRIPALAESAVEDGTRVFDLTMQTGRTDLTGRGASRRPGVSTALTWRPRCGCSAASGSASTSATTCPRPRRCTGTACTSPRRPTGDPTGLVEPGGTWSPSWLVDQPASSGWYHPHAHGTTAEHVRRGVYGMFLVDDPAAPAGLPDDYGVDDVPVMVQDVRFDSDGSLVRGNGFLEVTGPLGDTLLVNGTVGPFLDVTTETVRLRLLNASAARVYDFVLDDGRPMDLVATDGGLLPAPVSTGSVMLSPGERAEVVVRVEPGERVVLRSRPPDLGVAGVMVRMSGAGDRFDVLELRAADRLEPRPPTPTTLAAEPDLEAGDATVTRTFDLAGGNEINGVRMDMSRVDEVAETGTTEEWVVRNQDGMPHNFHLHGTSFVVAELGGSPPPAHLAGWKDTVLLAPGVTARLVVRHDAAPDPGSPFLYHCHLLSHHDQGMMGQLLVVGAGGEAGDVHDASHEAAEAPTDGRPDAGAGRVDEAARLFPGAAGHGH
jgi:suppressor of ftsI